MYNILICLFLTIVNCKIGENAVIIPFTKKSHRLKITSNSIKVINAASNPDDKKDMFVFEESMTKLTNNGRQVCVDKNQKLKPCAEGKGKILFAVTYDSPVVRFQTSNNRCITLGDEISSDTFGIVLETCSTNNSKQKWIIDKPENKRGLNVIQTTIRRHSIGNSTSQLGE